MSFVELFLIAVGLSMDAFAVSVCKGLSVQRLETKHAAIVGAYFGGFQFLMPVIGYLLGARFESLITNIDHWVAFGLLLIIGGNMIKESFGEAEKLNDDFGVMTMALLAVATSIDAFAIGITFTCMGLESVSSVAMPLFIIALGSFLLALTGKAVGVFVGKRFEFKGEFFGGIILILLGIKTLAWG